MSARRVWPVIGVGLAIASMLVWGLGRDGLWSVDEVPWVDAIRSGRGPEATLVRVAVAVLGPTDLAVRVPGALLAFVATVALGVAVAECVDRRAGLYAALAYVSLPLVFANARHATGATFAQSTFTLGFALVALFAPVRRARAVVGGVAVALAVIAFVRAPHVDAPSFDALLEHIGHATSPWTGIFAFGVVRLLSTPADDRGGESWLRLTGLVALVGAFAAQSVWPVPGTPFVAAAPLAVAGGMLLRDLERRARADRVLALGVLLVSLIGLRDRALFPLTLLTPLALANPPAIASTIPLPFVGAMSVPTFALVESVVFVVLAVPALYLGPNPTPMISFGRPVQWLVTFERAAARIHGRRPAFVTALLARLRYLVVASALAWALACVGCASLAPTYALRTALRVCALLPVLAIAATYLLLALHNAVAAVPHRLALVPFAALLVALTEAHALAPALARSLSPRSARDTLVTLRSPGDLVARLGAATTRWYAPVHTSVLARDDEAAAWLLSPGPRRFLLVPRDRLASLNRSYRLAQPRSRRTNLPIASPPDGAELLATSDLRGAPSRNPLDDIVGTIADTTEPVARVRFGDAIDLVGFDREVTAGTDARAGETLAFRARLSIVGAVPADEQMFIHVDGPCPRINSDHVPVPSYPPAQWLVGDVVHESVRFTIPVYCRAGRYTVFGGFFRGDERMRVVGGEHDGENRAVLATLEIR